MTSKSSENKTVEEVAFAKRWEKQFTHTTYEEYEKFIGICVHKSWFIDGFVAGQAALLEQASEGFDEFWDYGQYLTTVKSFARDYVAERIWQAATLAAENRHQKELEKIHQNKMEIANLYTKEREEMLKDLEWALTFVPQARPPHSCSNTKQKLHVREKWFQNENNKG